MTTHHERFWEHDRFAFVGHSAAKGFPRLSYAELRGRPGKTVFAVDPSVDAVEGDRAYPDLASLPGPVDAVVIQVPPEETASWVERAADAGIQHVWIHMGRETAEALEVARRRGLDVHTGTCAVMYVKPGFSYHSLHRWANRLAGRY